MRSHYKEVLGRFIYKVMGWTERQTVCLLLLLVVAEDEAMVFEQSLDCHTLGLDVCQLPLNVHGPHNSGGKNDCQIERRHLNGISTMLELNIRGEMLTRFSLECLMTRDKWKTRNWRQSRCARGMSSRAAAIA